MSEMRALQADPADNVAVVQQAVAAGDRVWVNGTAVTAAGAIPLGHKMALEEIPVNAMVVKYGVPIGRASAAIRRGEHAHTHNMEDITGQLCREYAAAFRKKAGEEQ